MAGPAPFSTRTSGDFAVDRLYAYGDAAFDAGDLIAARDIFAEVAARAPAWPPARVTLGKALLALGETAAAVAAFAHAIRLDPADRLGAGLFLAQLSGTPPGRAAMPEAYVAALFDDYAPRFDAHLVTALAYRAPGLIAALIGDAAPDRHFAHAIDLGCGTGLMAGALAGRSARFTGVDLSAGMLAEAEKSGRYARLVRAELAAFLATEATATADLVVAADVFCYLPDLGAVFAETARVLTSGGLCAFSIQTHAGAGARLGEDARIHHAPGMIHDLAARSGLTVVRETAAATRLDRGSPVPGALFVLAKG